MDALDGAHCLVIVTEWQTFRAPDFAQMARRLKDRMVFDGRNLYDPTVMARHGLGYQCIGRPAVAAGK
jgi:UDPglucose 6-dehydrogenase